MCSCWDHIHKKGIASRQGPSSRTEPQPLVIEPKAEAQCTPQEPRRDFLRPVLGVPWWLVDSSASVCVVLFWGRLKGLHTSLPTSFVQLPHLGLQNIVINVKVALAAGKFIPQDLRSPRVEKAELGWSQTPVWIVPAAPSLRLHVGGQGLEWEEEKHMRLLSNRSCSVRYGSEVKSPVGQSWPSLLFARSPPHSSDD